MQRSREIMRSYVGILQRPGVVMRRNGGILQRSGVVMRRNGGSLQRSGVFMKRGIMTVPSWRAEAAACQAWLRSEERPEGAGARGGGVHVEHQPLLGHQLYPLIHALLALCG